MKFINIIIIIFLLLTINCVSAATITVDMHDNNTNFTFSSIQDAIDHAQENDSIAIKNGIYCENLIINKSVNIYSLTLDPKDVTIEYNDSTSPVIHILSDYVKINGITIAGKNNTHPTAGIFVDNVDNSQIQNSVMTNVQDGLYIESSSRNYIQDSVFILNTEHGIHLHASTRNNVENNTIQENKRGFYLDESDKNIIIDNEINSNQLYGIALRESSRNTIDQNQVILNNIGLALTSSDKNTIFDNNINESKQCGIHLWLSNSNSVSNNNFADNKDAGIRLTSLSSRNIFEQNIFSNNLHGISIESTDNNVIKNNTFQSNEEHSLYHRYSDDKNIIENNSFADNPSENINLKPVQEIFIVIIVLIIISSIIAFHFRPPWWKAGIAGLILLFIVGLIILVVALFLVTIILYFPFESNSLENNVFIESLEINAIPINQTHSRIILSMNLDYKNKDTFFFSNNTGDAPNNLPVSVQISASTPIDGLYSDEDMELVHEEQVIIEYLGSNHYEYILDMESGKNYAFLVEVKVRRELPYPHPRYGEVKWEFLGGLSEEIDLR